MVRLTLDMGGDIPEPLPIFRLAAAMPEARELAQVSFSMRYASHHVPDEVLVSETKPQSIRLFPRKDTPLETLYSPIEGLTERGGVEAQFLTESLVVNERVRLLSLRLSWPEKKKVMCPPSCLVPA